MTTLRLTKKHKGEYQASAGNIVILISNSKIVCGMGSNDWHSSIEIEGVQCFDEFYTTKKQAVKATTQWIINNL